METRNQPAFSSEPLKTRLNAGLLLFSIGLVFDCVGYILMFWHLKEIQQNGVTHPRAPNFALGFILSALLCLVIAPFYSKRPLWLKIGLSISLIVGWSLLGHMYEFILNRAFGFHGN
jgi:hypothetical protein